MLKTAFLTAFPSGNVSRVAICFPKLTDVRAYGPPNEGDLVECPKGSGRWYLIEAVDDVAKGFDNEYRMAACRQLTTTPNMWTWPTP
jgi:hypothetical protein